MNKLLLDVFENSAPTRPPFWFMRQAGRYMPEYRALREKAGNFLGLCMNPDYATEVTMQPIRAFGMDAAILFADILLVPMAMGIPLEFAQGEGPKLGKVPHGSWVYDDYKLEPVYQTLRNLSGILKNSPTTLIGFAGSPWTVATYVVEGGSSRDFARVKTYALTEPEKFQQLIDAITDSTITYLTKQIEAGAEVLQLFDSWGGELGGDEFTRWVIKPTAKIVKALKAKHPQIKIIAFPRRANLYLPKYVRETGVDALSLDATVPLEWAFENLDCTLQGNLDQLVLLADKNAIKREAEKILKTAQGKRFIFNLGHGIVQQTPVENVAYLSDLIKNYSV